MGPLGWLIFWTGGLWALAYHRIALVPATIGIFTALIFTTFLSSLSGITILFMWIIIGGLATLLNYQEFRRKYIITPILEIFHQSLPTLSTTERQALEAGTVGWDKELFSGSPNWTKLLSVPAPKLTLEEQEFLNGPTTQVCEMVNDWDITQKDLDIPPVAWQFLKDNGFFGLIIPKKFGGKAFSAFAHATILTKLASRSYTLSTLVSVPNSLGPSELLMHYGTEEQKNYYLPRLATGEEIPCFALTGPEAGSDAGAMTDTGIICKGHFEGKEIIGIKLNWNKRYITLAPVATLLGLAFKLKDPQHLLGKKEELGITCALIPLSNSIPGITIGRRHFPIHTPFQNGPTQGKDVFVPLDFIIGGANMAGQGWRMLMDCLATGRAISLPATSAGGATVGTFTAGAYSFIRRQFKNPICHFEGIQEALSRMGAYTYISEATRNMTANYIDQGEKPAVLSAITKYHVTEFGRKISIDAMDVHGGKAVMIGPSNYLARSYEGAPIAITVEGANILTRSMIIFGQGAIRCHPFILNEMEAVAKEDIDTFENLLGQHTSHTLSNAACALFHGLTLSHFALSPIKGDEAVYYKQLTHASSAFALISDICMITLGGKLKFRESLSARLGDCLSMMVLGSATLKRFADQGSPKEDLPIVAYSMTYCLNQFWTAMDHLLHNIPNRFIGFALRAIVMPLGKPVKTPKDKLNKQIMKLLTSPNPTRDRLVGNIFISEKKNDPIRLLTQALQASIDTLPLRQRLTDAIKHKEIKEAPIKDCIVAALKAQIITEEEADKLQTMEELCQKVLTVDDFSQEELVPSISSLRASASERGEATQYGSRISS